MSYPLTDTSASALVEQMTQVRAQAATIITTTDAMLTEAMNEARGFYQQHYPGQPEKTLHIRLRAERAVNGNLKRAEAARMEFLLADAICTAYKQGGNGQVEALLAEVRLHNGMRDPRRYHANISRETHGIIAQACHHLAEIDNDWRRQQDDRMVNSGERRDLKFSRRNMFFMPLALGIGAGGSWGDHLNKEEPVSGTIKGAVIGGAIGVGVAKFRASADAMRLEPGELVALAKRFAEISNEIRSPEQSTAHAR